MFHSGMDILVVSHSLSVEYALLCLYILCLCLFGDLREPHKMLDYNKECIMSKLGENFQAKETHHVNVVVVSVRVCRKRLPYENYNAKVDHNSQSSQCD